MTFSSPTTGTTATGIATLTSGVVTGITITNGGTGYTSPPTITFTGGGGSAAQATASISNTSIVSAVMSASGSNFSSDPTATFLVGTGAVGVGLIGIGVQSVTITNGGSGYVSPPTVSFSGGGGTGAQGFATVVGGVVTGVTITNNGSGYSSAPSVGFGGGGGTGAAGTAVEVNPWFKNGVLTSVNITNGGSGYTTAPTVLLAAAAAPLPPGPPSSPAASSPASSSPTAATSTRPRRRRSTFSAPTSGTTATGTAVIGGETWVQLSASDSSTGNSTPVTTYYNVDQGSDPLAAYWTTYTTSAYIPVIGNGLHTVYYYSVDSVGNAETVHTLPINMDIVAPTVAVTQPANGTVGLPMTVSGTWTGGASGGAGLGFSVRLRDPLFGYDHCRGRHVAQLHRHPEPAGNRRSHRPHLELDVYADSRLLGQQPADVPLRATPGLQPSASPAGTESAETPSPRTTAATASTQGPSVTLTGGGGSERHGDRRLHQHQRRRICDGSQHH